MLYNLLLDIIKYTIAGIGIIYIAFYLFKPYLDKSNNIQLLELKKEIAAQTLPLRLQAYERLILFTERINPSNLLIRLNDSSYTAADLHAVIVSDIRTEYQHNVTQQIYVSLQAWGVVKRMKDDTLALVNSAAKGMPANATGLDLSKVILTHLGTLEKNPYDVATAMIRQDIEELF
ncbi:hypothetical protein FPZ43_04625 [Mucilaginibacter pallidiroseus]|uniref:Uncharacterized protein n=2 Tax=Mucilaginibacter pallidiroseus TaxID=2599295 RepID=A0A563UGY8_9SPHI|nr:hypothetical protein FPZ43_04625 [Mucilaginibacter pallidiroseus]